MSFPVRIKGTGRILGQVTLPGHSLESRSASPPSADGAIRTTTSRHPLVPGESLAELRRIYDDVRESLGGVYSKLAEPRQLAITDGGLLAFADARTGAIALPRQLLEPDTLALSESSRRLLLREMVIHMCYILMREDYCTMLRSYCDETGAPASIEWYAFQNVTVLLSGMQRFLNQDFDTQIKLRLAFEQVEGASGDLQPYSQMLRELQTVGATEVAQSHAGMIAALVQLSPHFFPDYTDLRLLEAATTRFRPQEGRLLVALDEVAEWLVERDEPTQILVTRTWPAHIGLSQSVGSLMRDVSARTTHPADALEIVSSLGNFDSLPALLGVARSQCNLSELCRPVEMFIRQMQNRLRLGFDQIQPLSRLAVSLACEHQGATPALAEQISVLMLFAEHLRATDCVKAYRVATLLAEELEVERREQSRRQAEDMRVRGRARERSTRALKRFIVRMSSAGEDADALRRTLKESLANQSDISPEDARSAIDAIIDRHRDRPALAGQMMAELMKLVSKNQVAPAIERALARRISFLHEVDRSYDSFNSTDLAETYASLMMFEDDLVDLDEREARAELRSHTQRTLNRERGLFKGLLRSIQPKKPLSETSSLKISRTLIDLRRRHEAGKPKAREQLADAHFRFGFWALVNDSMSSAIHHFCEQIRLTLDETLHGHLGYARQAEVESRDRFLRANACFRSRELELRRARAAGAILEAIARQAERAVTEGVRPAIEEELLYSMLKVLETGKTLGDRPPVYRLLRMLPRIVMSGRQQMRVYDLVPPNRAGRAGKAAILKHYFAGETWAEFLGVKVVETEVGRGQGIRRYVATLGHNQAIHDSLQDVFARLFGDLSTYLERRRTAIPCRVFASTVLSRAAEFLEVQSRQDHEAIQVPDVTRQQVGSGRSAFELLLVDFVEEMQSDYPSTLFSEEADENGDLARQESARLALEAALTGLRRDIAQRLRRQRGYSVGSREQLDVEHELRRMRAHSAVHALLFMDVGQRLHTARGRLVPLGQERIFPTLLDQDLRRPVENPLAPVSTRAGERIDAPWVNDRDVWMPYLEVAILYKTFITEHAEVIEGWAHEAGFSLEDATEISALLQRNSERLLPDLQTLVQCGGAVYISGNAVDQRGRLTHGNVITSIDAASARRVVQEPDREHPPEAVFKTTRLDTRRLRQRLATLKAMEPGAGRIAAG